MKKWRKTKGKGGEGYEASTCFMALDGTGCEWKIPVPDTSAV